jgi:hypothetical protein
MNERFLRAQTRALVYVCGRLANRYNARPYLHASLRSDFDLQRHRALAEATVKGSSEVD